MQHSFGHQISIISRYLHMWVNSQLEVYGIGSGQFHFLKHIGENEGISQKELSRRIVVDKATTAKAVRKLIELNYIEVRKNQEDNRVHKLYLTETGRAILPGISSVLRSTSEVLQRGMDEGEIEAATKLLIKMRRNISAQVEKASSKEEDRGKQYE